MRKIYDHICDAAVVVGCCIGVGFLCGKEAQVFFGNVRNVVIFAAVFFTVNVLLREYCRKNSCGSLAKLSHSIFGKFAVVPDIALATCCFVCIVTMLAGVEQCLSMILPVSDVLPLYGVVTSVIAGIVLGKGMKALKTANVIALLSAVVLITVLICLKGKNGGYDNGVAAYQPIVYALFSATMSLGATTQLGAESDLKRNVVTSAAATAILAALTVVIMNLSDFSLELPAIENVDDPYVIALAVTTLTLSAVTGIVANAMPIVEQIYTIVPDNALCCFLVFGLALAFSMFGFDFAVRFGYILVGAIGAVVIAACVLRAILKRRKPKNA